MVNDTNTLNGALSELGELMASNLRNKRIDDAQATDGLTTLSNKINDIVSIEEGIVISNSYYSNNANATVTIQNDNSILLENNGTGTYYVSIIPSNITVTSLNGARIYNENRIVEIDIDNYTGGSLQINSANGGATRNLNVLDYNKDIFHIKYKIENNTVYYYSYSSNQYVAFTTSITPPYSIRFGLPSGTSITFRNLKVYLI